MLHQVEELSQTGQYRAALQLGAARLFSLYLRALWKTEVVWLLQIPKIIVYKFITFKLRIDSTIYLVW